MTAWCSSAARHERARRYLRGIDAPSKLVIAERHREVPRAPDYDHPMGNRAHDLGFDLPDGWTCTRSAAGPVDGVPTAVMTPEAITAAVRPGAFTDPVARERHVMRHAGSIRLGFVPRKADYRALWRYNSEEFDGAE